MAIPPVHPDADVLMAWNEATALAREFWRRVQDELAISRDFAQIARDATP